MDWAAPISALDADDAAAALGSLPSIAAADDEQAKCFDLIMLEGDDTVAQRTRMRVQSVAALLLEKQTLSQVAAVAELLEQVANDEW